MQFQDLLSSLSLTPSVLPNCPPDMEIFGLTADSRKVQNGYIFAGLSGYTKNGTDFIKDAEQRGACLILTGEEPVKARVPVLHTPHPQKTFAKMAARFFAYAPAHIVAVTGTNGKSSVVEFYRHIVTALGKNAASMGTMGVITKDKISATSLTTPDAVAVHSALRDLALCDVAYVAMEASSHGLAQYRMDGVTLRAACFTNISRDHLDYHQNEDDYFAAKARLVSELLPPHGLAVIHLSGAGGARMAALAEQASRSVLTVGADMDADLRYENIQPQKQGLRFTLSYQNDKHDIDVSLAGAFQVENLGCAVGLALANGFSFSDIVKTLPHISAPCGRMEQVGTTKSGAVIYIDYAHTPDALENALTALRAHCAKRLVLVFGCGGNRDAGKRPLMGGVAHRLADEIFITDDNPRYEDAARIRAQIYKSCPSAINMAGRAQAICEALQRGQAGDVILIAGKGHETDQIIGTRSEAFSDHLIVQNFMMGEMT